MGFWFTRCLLARIYRVNREKEGRGGEERRGKREKGGKGNEKGAEDGSGRQREMTEDNMSQD